MTPNTAEIGRRWQLLICVACRSTVIRWQWPSHWRTRAHRAALSPEEPTDAD